jgi:hypothetical protein
VPRTIETTSLKATPAHGFAPYSEVERLAELGFGVGVEVGV